MTKGVTILRRQRYAVLGAVAMLLLTAPTVIAQGSAAPNLDLTKTTGSLPVQILVLLTLLSFIPAILISMTCFTRLIVVFHFLRQALGTQETPNNQVLIGLSLFLTMFVMAPVMTRVNQDALQPMLAGQLTQTQAIERALVPLRAYMLKHTRERDLALFIKIANDNMPNSPDDVATTTLVPAFMISELKTAFQIGFVLFISADKYIAKKH